MKKYLLLPTILALAACSGGDHHNGGNGMPPFIPDANKIQPADITSNAKLTSMASEIGVDADGNWIILARNATGSVIHNGIRYTAYRLDDVDFKALINMGDTDDLRFTIDKNGRIDGIQFENDSHCTGDKCPGVLYTKMARIDDTNKFSFVSPNTTGTAEYISHGRDMGLKYADFGTVKIDGTFNGNTYRQDVMFAGGYDVMEIDDDDIHQNVTFTGNARGHVSGANNTSIDLADNNATLTFDRTNGTESLNAKFFNWYDVNVVKNNATDQINIALDDTNKTIDNNVKFTNAPSANLHDGTNTTPNGVEIVEFETGYYGPNKNPMESTALFQYHQAATGGNTVTATIGFGGKK